METDSPRTASAPAELPLPQADADLPPPKWQFWKKKPLDPETLKYPPVPYWKLFRHATTTDKLMMLGSLAAAAAHGTLVPIQTVMFGRVVDQFGQLFLPEDHPNHVKLDEISQTIDEITNVFLILAGIALVLSFFQLNLAHSVANRLGNDFRYRFFDSLLRQDATFYDDSEAGSLTNIVISDISLVQAGIGDKLATATQHISTFIVGIVVSFVYGWKLALLILGVAPALMITAAISSNLSAEATTDSLGAYGEAGGTATEVLALIRTVTAFHGQEEEARRYEKSLDKAYHSSVKSALNTGLGWGATMFLMLCMYGLAFWVGSNLERSGDMSAGDVLLTFFSILLGANSLGMAGPAFKAFGVARAAAPRVFEIIDRKSPIDPLDKYPGIVPSTPISGRISFEGVDFNYAKRITEDESDLVLNNFSLDISAGSSEAFVGKSGCGKSTIARLIQRLYDPMSGSIKLDGVDLRELNVRWLRSQIGVVAQTPSLFMLSIRENIALGAGLNFSTDEATGKVTATRQQLSDKEIIAAAKMANAHDFITKLPGGYDTMLGERGAMLSGGQKQRVCIARALVRNPKVLLLDESTASLDTASERIVQDALEKASEGRTTVTIAHRLSTIKSADQISCIHSGRVIERGSHGDLIKKSGFYEGLFELQNIERTKLEKEKATKSMGDEEDEFVFIQPGTRPSIGKADIDSTSFHRKDIEDEEKKPDVDKGLFMQTLRMSQDEMLYLLLGVAGAVLSGVIWPLAALGLTQLIEIMVSKNSPSDVRFWTLYFVILGVLALLGSALQHGVLGIFGEKLTRKLRSLAFRSLLRQEIGYFDMEGNSVGALAGCLSSDAGLVKGLTGDLLGVGVNVVASLTCGLAISFAHCWRISLVVLAIIPGIVLAGYFQVSAGADSGARKDFAKASTVAAEAVDNISTVRTLGVEDYFKGRYYDMIRETKRPKLRQSMITGVAFGFSEFCQFLIWFATFKAGGDFVSQGHCTFKEMLLSSMAILFAAVALGSLSMFAPDLGASQLAATHVYHVLDRESEIDPSASEGEDLDRVEGDIATNNVYFEYPRRPDVPVLQGLTLEIAKSKTLAIVGTSGHGKSTIIALLERFYTMREGLISVDGRDISQVKVPTLRSHLGLVSQEPELFNRSVFDNIAYGAPKDDGSPISMSDVVEAARDANAHDFIEALPQGYDTLAGPRGDALSGGERQRVALARSLIRRPPVLLLDEATSALDSDSERVVQEALDRAASGRTTIIVAHRLSTIRNADTIAVVRKGRIVESGTHDVLLRKNGFYSELIQHQLADV